MRKLFFTFALALSLELATAQSCVTGKNLPGVCKRPRLCPEIAAVMNKIDKTPKDYEFLQSSHAPCGVRNKIPYVCCSLVPQPPQCGVQLDVRIFGGNVTKIKEFPWLAMLRYETLGQKSGGCGGALISSRYVLTAAHCVTGLRTGRILMEVRLGEHDIRTPEDCDADTEECTTHVDVKIEKIFVNKDYSPRYKTNDIALLRLSEEVEFTDHIRPICLPSSSTGYELKNLTVAGWGKTENVTTSPVKMKVSLPLVQLADCSMIYANQRFPQDITAEQICAGGVEGKDACSGDSGAPLMFMNTDADFSHWEAIGVVSFGPNACGKAGVPGVYSKIFNYIDWIYKNIEP